MCSQPSGEAWDARVSKTDGSQSLDLQRDALRAAGIDDAANLYHDLAAGVRDDRPGLDSCLRRCGRATCSSSGSSTGSAATSPTGQHRAGPVGPRGRPAGARRRRGADRHHDRGRPPRVRHLRGAGPSSSGSRAQGRAGTWAQGRQEVRADESSGAAGPGLRWAHRDTSVSALCRELGIRPARRASCGSRARRSSHPEAGGTVTRGGLNVGFRPLPQTTRGEPGLVEAPREGREAARRPGPSPGGGGPRRLRLRDPGSRSRRCRSSRPWTRGGAPADGPGARAAGRPGDDQAARCGRGAPAVDVLPHVPGDGGSRRTCRTGGRSSTRSRSRGTPRRRRRSSTTGRRTR